MRQFHLLIDGRLTDGAARMDVIDPATGGIVAAAPRADSGQMNAAVRAAKVAFPAWSALGVEARRSKLLAVLEGLEEFTQRHVVWVAR